MIGKIYLRGQDVAGLIRYLYGPACPHPPVLRPSRRPPASTHLAVMRVAVKRGPLEAVRRVTSSGTDNAIFGLGDRLAAATRFPVPAPVALGEPGRGYPLPWSVQAWLPGRTGGEDDPSGQVTFASDLAEFIAGVRAIGNPRPDVHRPRAVLRCTDLEWERSKAWAFQQAMGLVWYYADSNPVMSRLGRTTLDRIMAAALPEPPRAKGTRAALAMSPIWRGLAVTFCG